MACGTGKTLVGLWAAEQQCPKTVLVLVPSLALLSQAFGDWSMNTCWGDRFEYLCVCSDPSVSREVDPWEVRSTDVPFQVDTNPAEVRRFLERRERGKVRVVFSTTIGASWHVRCVDARRSISASLTKHTRRQDHMKALSRLRWTISGYRFASGCSSPPRRGISTFGIESKKATSASCQWTIRRCWRLGALSHICRSGRSRHHL